MQTRSVNNRCRRQIKLQSEFFGKDSIESAEELVSVKRARLEITPVKEDSLLTVKVKLIDLSTGTETAVPGTDLGVFVNRLFSALKLGEGKTDEAGEASIEIPNNLPGGSHGNITLLAKLDENEVYGNLEAAVTQQWGTPVSDELKELTPCIVELTSSYLDAGNFYYPYVSSMGALSCYNHSIIPPEKRRAKNCIINN